MNEEVRLNKYLSEMGICSRREADRLVESGKILVDGKPAVLGMKVSRNQEVICNGKTVGKPAADETKANGKRSGRVKPVLLVVNKPRGIVCTTSDKDRAPNIVEMMKYPSRIYPAGRLDKDSEGLLLMTNQGDLVNKIMRAGNAHEKEYVVTVDKPLTKVFLKSMAEGVAILDTVTRPCEIKATGAREFTIILTQGLNRQIRRMCEQLGYQVMTLKRVRIMNIRLGNLKTGDFRKVTPAEYKQLLEMLEDSSNITGQDTEYDEYGIIIPKENEHG